MKRLYRLQEVSKMLGGTPSARTLRDWCHWGRLRCSCTPGGRVYLMDETAVAALVAQMRRGPRA